MVLFVVRWGTAAADDVDRATCKRRLTNNSRSMRCRLDEGGWGLVGRLYLVKVELVWRMQKNRIRTTARKEQEEDEEPQEDKIVRRREREGHRQRYSHMIGDLFSMYSCCLLGESFESDSGLVECVVKGVLWLLLLLV